MNREQLELVTAYVDGEATVDERARVEGDAELLAEVEFQRAARAALHDVDPPSDANRESAIAAALAVFDDEIAGTVRPAAPLASPDVTAPTNIVPFERRRRMRWMQSVGAAAAVTAVVVAGAVIATRGGGDNGTTADQVRDSTVLSVAGDELDQDAAHQAPAAASATTATDVLMAVEPTQEPMADATDAAEAEAPPTSMSEYDGAAPAEAPGGAPGAAPPTSVPSAPAPPAMPASEAAAERVIIVVTEDDLRELADTLKATPPDLDDAETDCADRTLKAEATFEDDDGSQHPIVIVTIDDDTLGAFTLDDCDVVLETELDPTP